MRLFHVGLRALDSLLFQKKEESFNEKKEESPTFTSPSVDSLIASEAPRKSSPIHTTSSTPPSDTRSTNDATTSRTINDLFGISEPIFKVALRRFAISRGSPVGFELVCESQQDRVSKVLKWHNSTIGDIHSSSPQPNETSRAVAALGYNNRRDSAAPSEELKMFSSPEVQNSNEQSSSHSTSVMALQQDDHKGDDIIPECTIKEIVDPEHQCILFQPYVNPKAPMNMRPFEHQYPDPTKEIPNHLYVWILQQHIPALRSVEITDEFFDLGPQSSGTYHIVQIIGVRQGPYAGKYVIKMPRTGSNEQWTAADACNLSSEANTMDLIRSNTKCPIPQVIGYNAHIASSCLDHRNTLGVPYIIMRFTEGVPAQQIWHTWEENKIIPESKLSPEQLALSKTRRKNFIQSLARAMASLKTISFSRIGTISKAPTEENAYQITNTYKWWINGPSTQGMSITPTFGNEDYYWASGIFDQYKVQPFRSPQEVDEAQLRAMGEQALIAMIVSRKPFIDSRANAKGSKQFVLKHEDLDFQNILCDPETGNVVGIIDWDSCRTAPRSIGYSSLPLFLIRDWHPDYKSQTIELSGDEIVEYREMYADAMRDAIGDYNDDAKYTLKSGLYQAIYSSLYGSGLGSPNKNDILARVIAKCDTLNMYSTHQLLVDIGKAQYYQDGTDRDLLVVQNAINKLLACE